MRFRGKIEKEIWRIRQKTIRGNGDEMKRTETTLANAKINLFLNVVGRRADGYHLIDGVMQSVTLSDRVTVGFSPASETRITLTAEGNREMPTDMTNLACRAASRYLEATGICGEVEIRLEKRIPMAAGLAGGSTDAAAVLRLLNRVGGKALGIGELCEIGATLGADVPFCLRGGAMRTEGIGDILTPCAGMPECYLVVACAGNGVSTPWAYGQLDNRPGGFPEPPETGKKVEKLIHALQKRDLFAICGQLENVFESMVAGVNPFVDRIKRVMKDSGALAAMMSGSGPSVFGVFNVEGKAVAACRSLAEIGITGHLCRPAEEEISDC